MVFIRHVSYFDVYGFSLLFFRSIVLFHVTVLIRYVVVIFFFFQAEDGIRDLVRSRGLGDVYKRQRQLRVTRRPWRPSPRLSSKRNSPPHLSASRRNCSTCLLYTSDAADERSSVDLGGRRIIKKKKIGGAQACQK